MASPQGYVSVTDLPITAEVTAIDSIIVIKNAGLPGQFAAKLLGSNLGGQISRAIVITDTPVNRLIPTFIGQFAFDLYTDKLYIAKDMTAATGWESLW
jgi:hypothetical protein